MVLRLRTVSEWMELPALVEESGGSSKDEKDRSYSQQYGNSKMCNEGGESIELESDTSIPREIKATSCGACMRRLPLRAPRAI